MKIALFFDGHCPLCSDEMQQLALLDHQNLLTLVDLQRSDFELLYPHIDRTQAMSILQAQTEDGSMLYGLDANCKAWELVGKRRWLRILRWPGIRIFADLGYLVFAKNRSLISYLATGHRRCETCKIETLDSRNPE